MQGRWHEVEGEADERAPRCRPLVRKGRGELGRGETGPRERLGPAEEERKEERGWAAGERRAGPRARKKKKRREREFGEVFLLNFFSNLFSFLKNHFKNF
jgi:hypothetical protein